MLFLEIFLTVVAWKRGFKAWALLPTGAAVLMGLLIGLSNPEIAEGDNFFGLIWIDILAVAALVFMVVAGAKRKAEHSSETKSEISTGEAGFSEQ